MQPAHPLSARLATAARNEHGFGLIEVLVTAVIVIIVGTAVFAGLDAASSASGRTKSRSIASTLAQRDQERLRSLDVAKLNNLRESSPQEACDDDGKSCLNYTIDSRTQWISDTTGTASCTAADARTDYLELISTVSWHDMRGAKPVVMKSIFSPPVGSFGPTQGSLAVKLVGADGVTPMPGVTVRLTGPKAFTDKTNALGCVVWGYLPVGSGYVLEFNEPGYVDPQGVQAVTGPASVIAETLTTRTFLYDRAATAKVSFFSKIGTTTYPGQKAERITLGHSQMLPTLRSFPLVAPTSAQASITTAPLFPFGSSAPYRIFAGACNAQDPDALLPVPPLDPLLTLPALMPGDVDVAYALQLPAIDSRITVNSALPTAATAPKYKITQKTTPCTSAVIPAVTATPVVGADQGRLMDMGRPYGTYEVCAQATIGTAPGVVYHETTPLPYLINTVAGTKVPLATGVINITTGDVTGGC